LIEAGESGVKEWMPSAWLFRGKNAGRPSCLIPTSPRGPDVSRSLTVLRSCINGVSYAWAKGSSRCQVEREVTISGTNARIASPCYSLGRRPALSGGLETRGASANLNKATDAQILSHPDSSIAEFLKQARPSWSLFV
jgi:hypothetical protein